MIPANCSSESAPMAYRNCSTSTASAFFFSRSPTQMIGVSPASSAATVFFSTLSSVSPKYLRRSLCPTITYEQPEALIIRPETSPVKAPSFAQHRFCAPMCILVPRVALTAVSKSRNDGQITISQCPERSTNGRKLSKKHAVPAGSLYIFQFPTIKGVRMTSTPVNQDSLQYGPRLKLRVHF